MPGSELPIDRVRSTVSTAPVLNGLVPAGLIRRGRQGLELAEAGARLFHDHLVRHVLRFVTAQDPGE